MVDRLAKLPERTMDRLGILRESVVVGWTLHDGPRCRSGLGLAIGLESGPKCSLDRLKKHLPMNPHRQISSAPGRRVLFLC